jgi:FkbM family methyltransferase
MGIGAQSSLWRRALLRTLAPVYLRRRAATADGAFETYVSGGSSLKLVDPRGLPIDPTHTAFIRNWVKRDSIIWDVGANVGLFAFPAALKARDGRVYSFEPDPKVVRQVERSLTLPLNKGLPVTIVGAAISDRDGVAEFEISAYSTAMSRLKGASPWQDDQVKAREVRTVVTLTIDTLAKTLIPPSIIKIDVEGAEMHVLEGARSTIAQYRPIILIEAPMELSDQLAAFFHEFGYVMLNGGISGGELITTPSWDTIAIPAEVRAREMA